VDESDAFAVIEILSAYKRLWVRYQTLKFAHENPESPNLTKLEGHSFYAVLDAFEPVFEALHAGRPIQEPLQVALQTLEAFR
jgi:hypothetical protein